MTETDVQQQPKAGETKSSSRFRLTNGGALVLALLSPLVFTIVAQLLLFEVASISGLLNAQPDWIKMGAFYAVVFAPSYVILLALDQPWPRKTATIGGFSIFLIPYIPFVAIYGLFTSCAVLGKCL